MTDEAAAQLLDIAEAAGHIERWAHNTAREMARGLVPHWDAERAKRRGDLHRLITDLELMADRLLSKST